MKPKNNTKNEDEKITYKIERHLINPDREIVSVLHGKTLIGTLNIHVEKEKNRKYCVFTSKYIVNVYTNFDNPDALQVLVDLGKIK